MFFFLRCLTKQMNAIIEIKFSRPVCVELYRDNKVLGRFMIRYSGKTLAAGVITEVRYAFHFFLVIPLICCIFCTILAFN